MRPSLRRVAIPRRLTLPALVLAVAAAFVPLTACFDFDATMDGPVSSLADGGQGIFVGADATTGADTSVTPPPGDASVPPDAEPQGPDADTGSGPIGDGGYCASITPPSGTIFFCDDFDERPLPGAWATWHEFSGTMMITDAAASSPPSSVDESLIPLLLGQTLDVALRTPVGVPNPLPATLRFGFALAPVQIDTTANAAIVLGAIDFLDNAQDRYSVELAINVVSGAPALALGEQYGGGDGGPTPDGGPPYINHPLPPTQPIPMNAWTNIVIEIKWTAPFTAEGIVTINGATQLDTPLSLSVAPTSLQIGIGTSYVSEPSPVWELRYDNVWFTAK